MILRIFFISFEIYRKQSEITGVILRHSWDVSRSCFQEKYVRLQRSFWDITEISLETTVVILRNYLFWNWLETCLKLLRHFETFLRRLWDSAGLALRRKETPACLHLISTESHCYCLRLVTLSCFSSVCCYNVTEIYKQRR